MGSFVSGEKLVLPITSTTCGADRVVRLSRLLNRRIKTLEPLVLRDVNAAIKYFSNVFVNEEWHEFIDAHIDTLTAEQICKYVKNTQKPLPQCEQMLWDSSFPLLPCKTLDLHIIKYTYYVGRVSLFECNLNTIERDTINLQLLKYYLCYCCDKMGIEISGKNFTPFYQDWIDGKDLDFDTTFTQIALA